MITSVLGLLVFEEIKDSLLLHFEKDLRLNIGVDGRLTVERNFGLAAGNGITIEAQKAVTISAADELTLKCGQPQLSCKRTEISQSLGGKFQ